MIGLGLMLQNGGIVAQTLQRFVKIFSFDIAIDHALLCWRVLLFEISKSRLIDQ
jgi:hypothetical protein